MHKFLMAVFMCAACVGGYRAAADGYSTEATMWLQEAEGTLEVDVRVSRLTEQAGKVAREPADPTVSTGRRVCLWISRPARS